MDTRKFNRRELFDLVWSEPLSRIATKYSISDNGLRKICKRMNIPLPQMGHWQKVQYGKSVRIPKLPDKFEGKDEIILGEKCVNENEQDSPLSQLKNRIKQIECDQRISLSVPERLTKPDILVKNTIEYYDAIKRFHRSHSSYEHYPDRKGTLNIKTSENNTQRALRIMDTIIKVLRKRNHDVQASHWDTYAVFDKEHVKFRIREKHVVSDKKDNFGGRILENTEALVFVVDRGAYDRKEIIEGVEKLENKISMIVAIIEMEGERLIERSIQWEIQRKKQEEQQQIEREFKKLQEKEFKSFKDLFIQAERLHQANIIRTYIQTVETSTSKLGMSYEEFKNWKEWAEMKVAWYDPLVAAPDKLLTDHHKDRVFQDLINKGNRSANNR
jgi:hypothetical protein